MSGYRGWRLLWVLPPCRVWKAGSPHRARWGLTFMHGICRFDRLAQRRRV
jgi:hypothetical protein